MQPPHAKELQGLRDRRATPDRQERQDLKDPKARQDRQAHRVWQDRRERQGLRGIREIQVVLKGRVVPPELQGR